MTDVLVPQAVALAEGGVAKPVDNEPVGATFRQRVAWPGFGTATPARTNNPNDGSAVTLIGSNPPTGTTSGRRGFVIFNESIDDLYVKCGAGASATSYTWLVLPGQPLTIMEPCYTGLISGAWSANHGGAAQSTEFTT